MDNSPSFSLGLTQLESNEPTNRAVGFVSGEFGYEEPNFDENRAKHRNDPIKMKNLKKVVDGRDCGVLVAGHAEYLSEGMNVPLVNFEAKYHHMRYATLL
ncbi:hypothetical protein BC332_33076 [Capsicum chinense]|nr:hypothetical protein BC332_33076 [Capsicum chinense]